MPGRDLKFANKGIYHVYTKTPDRSKIFNEKSLKFIFLELMKYYRSSECTLRYSNFLSLPNDLKTIYLKKLNNKKYFLIDIFCFSIMPTHFHLLIRQVVEGGVSHYISQILNSFTRFYNLKYDRLGSIFLKPFKAAEIRSEEQLKHVIRYIHLNEYSSGLLEKKEEIFTSLNSSMPRYLNNNKDELINKEFVLAYFGNNINRYIKFILNNSDYQRSLERIKYLEKWYKNIRQYRNKLIHL